MENTERKKTDKSLKSAPHPRRRPAKKKSPSSSRRTLWLCVAAFVAVVSALLLWRGKIYLSGYAPEDGKAAWVYIPSGATKDAVCDSLKSALGKDFGGKVAAVWSGEPDVAHGAYKVEPGARAFRVAKNIGRGLQSPVKIAFNNVRTVEQLSERLSRRMEFSSDDFMADFDSVAKARGITPETLETYIFPDTYEAFWTDSPAKLLSRLESAHTRFWTDRRKSQATDLGLTPATAYILASIVEEESGNSDERPVIGRLYLNRLHKGMLLQADPTVKFANGDFAARRITGAMLRKESPYNTYRNKGLPPGPIRFVETATIDGILNSEPHSYIYMCAKADFSGRHAFASDYAEHQRNAAAYHKALDARGIK
jgi:hypothetical protein